MNILVSNCDKKPLQNHVVNMTTYGPSNDWSIWSRDCCCLEDRSAARLRINGNTIDTGLVYAIGGVMTPATNARLQD